MACEFLSAARKLSSDSFTPEQAWDRLEEFAALLTLVPPSPSVLLRARPLVTTQSVQFWDAMIYAACLEVGVTRLYSEDLPGRAIAGLEIVNPFRAE